MTIDEAIDLLLEILFYIGLSLLGGMVAGIIERFWP
jgi:hypothetical protein